MKKALLLCWIAIPSLAWGWSQHEVITEATLQKLTLKEAMVPYVPLGEALESGLSRVQARTVDAFVRELKLHKSYPFAPRLNESRGRQVFVNAILATYSNEPDWGPDQDLFGEDQYPELWKPDTKYVALRTGVGSNGFRHMYFPGKMDWKQPVSSFQIPMRPLGEAPQRAQLFYEIAQDMFRHGQQYWGYRFLAWSIHFVQDLYQPFHTRQCPTKSFMRFKFEWGFIPVLDIAASAAQIEYYHLSYENWISQRAIQSLKPELLDEELFAKFDPNLESAILSHLVPFSAGYAEKVATLSVEFFPELNLTNGSVEAKVGTDAWWKGITQGGPQAEALIEQTRPIWKDMGKFVRRMVADSH